MKKRECPICKGYGTVDIKNYTCSMCEGMGKIPMKLYMDYVRAHRRCEQ